MTLHELSRLQSELKKVGIETQVHGANYDVSSIQPNLNIEGNRRGLFLDSRRFGGGEGEYTPQDVLSLPLSSVYLLIGNFEGTDPIQSASLDVYFGERKMVLSVSGGFTGKRGYFSRRGVERATMLKQKVQEISHDLSYKLEAYLHSPTTGVTRRI